MMIARLSLSGTGGLLEHRQRGGGRAIPVVSAEHIAAMSEDMLARLRIGQQLGDGGRRSLRSMPKARRIARPLRTSHAPLRCRGRSAARRRPAPRAASARILRTRREMRTRTPRRYSDASVASSTYDRMLMRSACRHRRRSRLEIEARAGAILADDLEPRVRHGGRQRDRTLRSADRRGGAEKSSRRTARAARSDDRRRRSASRSRPSGIVRMRAGLMPMKRSISRLENSVSVITVRARRADQAVSKRRRTPSRKANHSGWAKNDTS